MTPTPHSGPDTEGFARDVRAAMRWVMELIDRADADADLGGVVAVDHHDDPTISDLLEQAADLLFSADVVCTDNGWIADPEAPGDPA